MLCWILNVCSEWCKVWLNVDSWCKKVFKRGESLGLWLFIMKSSLVGTLVFKYLYLLQKCVTRGADNWSQSVCERERGGGNKKEKNSKWKRKMEPSVHGGNSYFSLWVLLVSLACGLGLITDHISTVLSTLYCGSGGCCGGKGGDCYYWPIKDGRYWRSLMSTACAHKTQRISGQLILATWLLKRTSEVGDSSVDHSDSCSTCLYFTTDILFLTM